MRHAVAVALALFCAATCAAAGPLEGRWRITEQTYGSGDANLVSPDRPLHLEFYRDAAVLKARVWAARRTDAIPWPAIVTAGETRALHVDELWIAPGEDAVRALYRVEPSAGNGLVLEVHEEYRVVEDGEALVGTVKIAFLQDGEARGSYRLQRRFARQR